jgi:hypothetical protein
MKCYRFTGLKKNTVQRHDGREGGSLRIPALLL